MKKLYLAGGWFTPEMEEEHTRIYNLLKDKFDVYNPKLESLITKHSTNEQINNTLLGNVINIDNADIVVVIYDRKDVGTIWEAGYAYAKYKPIIYYAETLGDKPFNLMLARTGWFAKNEQELLSLLTENSTYRYSPLVDNYKGDIE